MKTKLTINEKLATIQTKLKAKKSRWNGFGKYNYRSAEDILEAIKPFLLELNVTVTINETIKEVAGLPVMESIASISDGDTAIHAVALVGVDLNQRGMNVPQQFGSASSYGKKYSLGNLFLIDDTADSDATNSHSKDPIKKTLTGSATTPTQAKPKITAENIDKAKKFLQNNGKIETLIATYDIAPDILKQLKDGIN